MKKLNEFLKITEAARYIGVSPQTLRNWGKLGLIKHSFCPGGYRRFAKKDLDKILTRINK